MWWIGPAARGCPAAWWDLKDFFRTVAAVRFCPVDRPVGPSETQIACQDTGAYYGMVSPCCVGPLPRSSLTPPPQHHSLSQISLS